MVAPYQVAVDITNNCNYRCLHCYNSSGNNNVIADELTDERFLKLFTDIGKMKPLNVYFCGGEPLLRLELMLQCADILYQSGVTSIVTVSNGYHLTNSVAKQLKRSPFFSRSDQFRWCKQKQLFRSQKQ